MIMFPYRGSKIYKIWKSVSGSDSKEECGRYYVGQKVAETGNGEQLGEYVNGVKRSKVKGVTKEEDGITKIYCNKETRGHEGWEQTTRRGDQHSEDTEDRG